MPFWSKSCLYFLQFWRYLVVSRVWFFNLVVCCRNLSKFFSSAFITLFWMFQHVLKIVLYYMGNIQVLITYIQSNISFRLFSCILATFTSPSNIPYTFWMCYTPHLIECLMFLLFINYKSKKVEKYL